MNNIILIGFMGAGKTTIGKKISRILNVPFVDTDEQIEKEQNRTISDIFAKEGEEYFRKLETKQIEKLCNRQGIVIAVGGGLPIQQENHEILKRLGIVFYLKTKKEILVKRLRGDKKRPLLQGEDLEKKIEALMEKREAIYEQVADVVLLTDRYSRGKLIEKIIQEAE